MYPATQEAVGICAKIGRQLRHEYECNHAAAGQHCLPRFAMNQVLGHAASWAGSSLRRSGLASSRAWRSAVVRE